MNNFEVVLIKSGKEILRTKRNIVIVRLQESGEYGVMSNHIPFTAKLQQNSKIRDDKSALAEITKQALATFYKNKLTIIED